MQPPSSAVRHTKAWVHQTLPETTRLTPCFCELEMPVFFVQRGGTIPAGVEPTIEGPLHKRGGTTGQKGGRENWKSRHCRLVGHTLYYSEGERSTQPKGHLNLQGLGVRQADAETGRQL